MAAEKGLATYSVAFGCMLDAKLSLAKVRKALDSTAQVRLGEEE